MMLSKYKVTGMFGSSPEGEIRDVYILNVDDCQETALAYHAPDDDGDGCFEFVKLQGEYWISAGEEYNNLAFPDNRHRDQSRSPAIADRGRRYSLCNEIASRNSPN